MIIFDEPWNDYVTQARFHLTSHQLQLFSENPEQYNLMKMGAFRTPETRAMDFGTACHTMILEGDEKFLREYTVNDGPINPKTEKPYGTDTKVFKDWLAKQDGKILSSEEYERIFSMSLSVRNHEVASKLLSSGHPEVTVRCEIDGRKRQGRIDWLHTYPDGSVGIVDYKSCENLQRLANELKFQGAEHAYIRQLAYYHELLKTTHDVRTTHIVVTQTKSPHYTAVFEMMGTCIYCAKIRIASDLMRLTECESNDTWPNGWEKSIRVYPTRTDQDSVIQAISSS